MSRKLALFLLPLLGACAAQTQTVVPPASAGRPAARPIAVPPSRPAPPPLAGSFRAPRVMLLPGVDGVIGADANSLQRQFGEARLDVVEGDVHKLQFSGEACVLDIYLYPLKPGATPTATYVDARRMSDGLDVDRAACIKALRR